MLKSLNKSVSWFLIVAFIISMVGVVVTPHSFAMPRVENELVLDWDGEDGYDGKYVMIYNPSLNPTMGLTTGIIADQMKSVSSSIQEKEFDAHEIYRSEFKQRVSASEVKKALKEKAEKLQSQKQKAISVKYAEGDTRDFNIYKTLNDFYVTAVEFKLASQGEHCNIWVINGEKYSLTDEEAAAMAREYDEKIYDNMKNSFGEYEDPEETGLLNILVYDIQDGFGYTTNAYTCGYFSYTDLYPQDELGNDAAMIHIDTYPTIHWKNEYNIQEAYSTIVHEFQHLINFSQYLKNPDSPESDSSVMATWLNECCSLAAEELVYPNSVASYRLEDFEVSSNDNFYASGESLYAWTDDILNYSMAYVFGQYIRLQTGGYTAFKKMLDVFAADSAPTEAKAIEASVTGSLLENMSLSDIVLSCRIAMLANEVSAYDGIYGFCGSEVFDVLPAMTYTSSKTPKVYGGGTIIIETGDGTFTPSSKASSNLKYVGIDFAENLPTQEPTLEPTLEPTIEVTAEPTIEPTVEVTSEPTQVPVTYPPDVPYDHRRMGIDFEPDKTTVLPGDIVNVTLSLFVDFSDPLSEVTVSMRYDNELFELVDATVKEEFASVFEVNSEESDILTVSLKKDEVSYPNMTIDVATFELKALDASETTISYLELASPTDVICADGKDVEYIWRYPQLTTVIPIKNTSVDYESRYMNIDYGTTLDTVANYIEQGFAVKAFADGAMLSAQDKIANGTLLVLSDENGFDALFTAILLGDNNSDAKINSKDIAFMQRVILADAADWSENMHVFLAMDMNGDTKVNSKDLSVLQRIILSDLTPVSNSISSKAATSPVIKITASKEVVTPGETITVTVAFDPLWVTNLAVMELIIPINVDAFTFVQDSAQFYLSKGENAIGDAIFLTAKNQFFCNYVDVSTPLTSKTTTVCSFKLTAKQNVDNVTSVFEIADTSFLCDPYLNDISFTAESATVSISSAQGLRLVGGSTYSIDTVNRYLKNVSGSTTCATVKSNFTASGTLRIEKANGTALNNDDKVATGNMVKLYSGTTVLDSLTVIVSGDVTGDGLVNSRDIAMLQRHVTGNSLLTNAFFVAGDLTLDAKINSRDLASLQRIVAA